jgi:hypothetical protein
MEQYHYYNVVYYFLTNYHKFSKILLVFFSETSNILLSSLALKRLYFWRSSLLYCFFSYSTWSLKPLFQGDLFNSRHKLFTCLNFTLHSSSCHDLLGFLFFFCLPQLFLGLNLVHNAAFFNIPEKFSTILFKSSDWSSTDILVSKDFCLKDILFC